MCTYALIGANYLGLVLSSTRSNKIKITQFLSVKLKTFQFQTVIVSSLPTYPKIRKLDMMEQLIGI